MNKPLTLEQCEQADDYLTEQAISFANMIRTPKHRALAAKDVIAGMPDRPIGLTYNGQMLKAYKTLEGSVSELQDTQEKTTARLNKNISVIDNNFKEHAKRIKATEDRLNEYDKRWDSSAKYSNKIEKKIDEVSSRADGLDKKLAEMEKSVDERVSGLESQKTRDAEWWKGYEKGLQQTIKGKASRAALYFVGLASLAQAAYIAFELSQQPDTLTHKAYEAAKTYILEKIE